MCKPILNLVGFFRGELIDFSIIYSMKSGSHDQPRKFVNWRSNGCKYKHKRVSFEVSYIFDEIKEGGHLRRV